MKPRYRTPAAAIGLAWLTGCATPPAAPDPQAYVAMPAAPPGAGRGGAPVVWPSLPERLRFLALQEWALWGRSRWDSESDVFQRLPAVAPQSEDTPEFASRVLHYWYAFKPGGFAPERARHADGSLLPWSAVFISYLMKTAGVAPELFTPSELHWAYIRAILDAPNKAGFEVLDAGSQAPAIGDVVCAPRDSGESGDRLLTSWAQLNALTRQEKNRVYAFHCDLVVDITPTALGAIGGNVNQSVVWTRVALDARGLLRQSAQRPWLLVLRNNLK